MARISVIQLADFPATPSWAQQTLTQAQVYAEQITGATGRAEEMAWATGSAAQAGWAEVQRQILALPAVGLPECIPGLTSELQDLAKGSWGIGQLQASRAWLKTSGMGPAIGDILASVQAGNGKFPAAFSDYSTKAIGKAIEVVVGEAPVVGWIFQVVYSSISFLIRRQAEFDKLAKANATPAQTGVAGIAPPFGGPGAINRARAIDLSLLARVQSILPDVSSSQSAGGTSQDLDLNARASDLTRAFMPATIPSGMAALTPNVAQENDILFATEDLAVPAGETSIDGLRLFASRPVSIDENLGVGYVPGLRRIMGWDSIVDLEGFPRLYTDPLAATTQALAKLEWQCLRPPWCYMIDIDAIESSWKAAVDGWRSLKVRIHYAMRGGNASSVFREGSGMVPRVGERVVRSSEPGWWINVSRVLRKLEGGQVVERIVPGPPLWPRTRFEQGSDPGGYVMGPLDYFSSVEYGGDYSTIDDPESVVGRDIAENPESLQLMADPWALGAVQGTRAVYRPGEYGPSWGEPYEGLTGPGVYTWPMVPEGEVVEWVDPVGQLSVKGSTVQTGSILDLVIRPWLAQVRAAQEHYLGTHWCAYVHPGMPAFRASNSLRVMLGLRFAQLLQSPSRFELRTADVMDDIGPGSRRELLQNAGVCFPGKVACVPLQADPTTPKPPIVVTGFVPVPDVPDVDPEDPPAPIPPADVPPPVPPGDETPPDEPDATLDPQPSAPSPWPWAVAAAAVGYAAAKGKD